MIEDRFVRIYINIRGELVVAPPINQANYLNKSDTINLDLIKKIEDSTLSPLSKAILNKQIK